MIIPYNPQFYKQNVSLFSQKWPTFLNRKKYETILPTHFILSNKSQLTVYTLFQVPSPDNFTEEDNDITGRVPKVSGTGSSLK